MAKPEPDYLDQWDMFSIFTTNTNWVLQLTGVKVRRFNDSPVHVYYMKLLPPVGSGQYSPSEVTVGEVLEFSSKGKLMGGDGTTCVTRMVHGEKLRTARASTDYSKLICGSVVQTNAGTLAAVLQHTTVRDEKFILLQPIAFQTDNGRVSEFPISHRNFWWSDQYGNMITISDYDFNRALTNQDNPVHHISNMEEVFDPTTVAYTGVYLNKILFQPAL